MRHADRPPPSTPTRRAHAGSTIVEALVAALLLTVGALALVALATHLRRDERRAATRDRAAELLEERLVGWDRAPCGAGGGERTVGALRERWSVERAGDSLELLRDSIVAPADTRQDGASLVAVRGCAP